MPQPALQDDVVRAFSVRTDRVFQRANGQIYAIIGINPDFALITDVWFGQFDTQDEFRAVLNHLRARFEEGGYRYGLADLRFLTSDFSASEDWVVHNLAPALFEAGLEREALVLPDTAVTGEGAGAYAAGARTLRDIADSRIRGFTNIALAKKWLLDGAAPDY